MSLRVAESGCIRLLPTGPRPAGSALRTCHVFQSIDLLDIPYACAGEVIPLHKHTFEHDKLGE